MEMADLGCRAAIERSMAAGFTGGSGATGGRTPEPDAEAIQLANASAETPNQTTRRRFMLMPRIVARPSGDYDDSSCTLHRLVQRSIPKLRSKSSPSFPLDSPLLASPESHSPTSMDAR